MADRKENTLTPATVEAGDKVRGVKSTGESVLFPEEELGGGGAVWQKTNNTNITISNDDGITDAQINNMTADKALNLPELSENPDRVIRIWHGNQIGLNRIININCFAGDYFDNGFDTTTISFPLVSPGDMISLRADAPRGRWIVMYHHAAWRKGVGYTYGANFTDLQDGTKIRRVGFKVELELVCYKTSGEIVNNDLILTVDSSYRDAAGVVEVPGYNGNSTTPVMVLSLFKSSGQGRAANIPMNGAVANGLYFYQVR